MFLAEPPLASTHILSFQVLFGCVEHTLNKAAARLALLRWALFQFPGIDHELAMAYGDAFSFEEVGAFQLADLARHCGIDRRLLKREASRLAKAANDAAKIADEYL